MQLQTQIQLDNNTTESVWMVPGYAGKYAINENGLYSSALSENNTWKKMKTPKASSGYPICNLTDAPGCQTTYAFHTLLYYSAVDGVLGSGREYVIDHIDGDRSNNKLNNLQKITFKENIRKGNRTKINAEIATMLWHDHLTGDFTPKKLAEKHNVSISIVDSIIYGGSWNDITGIPIDKESQKRWYSKIKAKRLAEKEVRNQQKKEMEDKEVKELIKRLAETTEALTQASKMLDQLLGK